jgi:hypothetical protein
MIDKGVSSRHHGSMSKRTGTAFWLSDHDGDLLRAVAAAEDRTLQAVLRRALAAYANQSPEYRDASPRRCEEVDYIDGDPGNNSPENLRVVEREAA